MTIRWRAFACAGNAKNGIARKSPPLHPPVAVARRLRNPRLHHLRPPSLPRQAAVSAVVGVSRRPRLRKHPRSRKRRRLPPPLRHRKSSKSSRHPRSARRNASWNLQWKHPRNRSRHRVLLVRHRRRPPHLRRPRRPLQRRSAPVRARSFPVPHARGRCRAVRHLVLLGRSRRRHHPAVSAFRLAATTGRAEVAAAVVVAVVVSRAVEALHHPDHSVERRASVGRWTRKK